MKLRLIAARIIDDVTHGCSLTNSLETALPQIKDARDRAFVQAVCYGVCRYYSYLDVLLSHLLTKPMKEKDSNVHALLLVGLYQLTHMRIPEHAAVAETVNAVSAKKSWARGFVNAILREFLRNKNVIEDKLKLDEEAVYAHPEWWIAHSKKAWPDHWQNILLENNKHPSFALRVNQQQITRAEYLQKLAALGLSAHIIPETTNGIVLSESIAVEELPGFSIGMISVQDGAAQLAAEILDLSQQQHVLDACAAPGGKLLHILEQEPHVTCVAVEKDLQRMKLIKNNLTRAKQNAQCFCADVSDVKKWWDGKLFDRILLDAPCSASGVVRRHPDIKLLRHASDIAVFAQEQYYLLQALWPLLKKGGLLAYATCSIFPQENVEVMQRFLSQHEDAKEEVLHANWGIACEVGRQILPEELDGFYYVKIKKV